jgi:hypothetical protein
MLFNSDLQSVSSAARTESDWWGDAETVGGWMTGARAFEGPVMEGDNARLEETLSATEITLVFPRSVNRTAFLEEEKLESLLKLLREALIKGETDRARKKLPITRTNRIKKKQCLTFIG